MEVLEASPSKPSSSRRSACRPAARAASRGWLGARAGEAQQGRRIACRRRRRRRQTDFPHQRRRHLCTPPPAAARFGPLGLPPPAEGRRRSEWRRRRSRRGGAGRGRANARRWLPLGGALLRLLPPGAAAAPPSGLGGGASSQEGGWGGAPGTRPPPLTCPCGGSSCASRHRGVGAGVQETGIVGTRVGLTEGLRWTWAGTVLPSQGLCLSFSPGGSRPEDFLVRAKMRDLSALRTVSPGVDPRATIFRPRKRGEVWRPSPGNKPVLRSGTQVRRNPG